MKKYYVLHDDEIVAGPFDNQTKALRYKYRYHAKNSVFSGNAVVVKEQKDIPSMHDMREHGCFDCCKTHMDVLEALYNWASDYKEFDKEIDSWLLCQKIKEAITAAEGLEF